MDTPKPRNFLKLSIFVLLFAAFLLVSYFLKLGQHIQHAKEWIFNFGVLAPVVYGILYIAGEIILIPGSALSVTASALFGPIIGLILVSICSTTGAGLSFLIARYFARGQVESWISKNEKIKKLDELSKIHGKYIVAITRLIPLFPFTLLNYAFGLTKINFWTYLFWSWLCMLPGTVLYVFGADFIVQITSGGKFPWVTSAIFLIGAGILAVAVRFARRKMNIVNKDTSIQKRI